MKYTEVFQLCDSVKELRQAVEATKYQMGEKLLDFKKAYSAIKVGKIEARINSIIDDLEFKAQLLENIEKDLREMANRLEYESIHPTPKKGIMDFIGPQLFDSKTSKNRGEK